MLITGRRGRGDGRSKFLYEPAKHLLISGRASILVQSLGLLLEKCDCLLDVRRETLERSRRTCSFGIYQYRIAREYRRGTREET